jgi:hypothetical protein
MTELRIGDQLIRFDREATIAAYSQIAQGGSDKCTCQGCRNFALQRERVYPAEFLEIINTLGIDPAKKGEAVHYGPKGPLQFYGGWFYFVGELLGERLVDAGNNFQFFIGTSFPKPPASFSAPVAVIKFTTNLPWSLNEACDLGAETADHRMTEIMERYSGALRALAKS